MKKTRTNKNHSTNKKIKIAVIATLTTLTLGFAGVSTAIYLQPSHYKGDTFTNAKTSVSSTTSSTSSSSSTQSESTNDSDTNNYYVYTESNSAEVTNNYSKETNNNSSNQVTNNQSEQTTNNNTQVSTDPYSLLNTNIDSSHKVVEYYNGYYIVTEECQTGYGTKYMYIVYNPETGELAPNGSDMIQEQRNWIDNYGTLQQSQSTETNEE